jgi:hypothetical protein
MGFWIAPIAFFLLSTAAAAYWLPQTTLDMLSDQARWGGPLWFGVLGGLVGLLRQRLQGLFEVASEVGDWRFVEQRLQTAQVMQRRLDQILAASLLLGLLAFFVPPVVSAMPSAIARTVAASPVGSACFVVWIFVVWSRWRKRIDEVHVALAVRKRQSAERKERLERLREGRLERSEREPRVTTGRLMTRDQYKAH